MTSPAYGVPRAVRAGSGTLAAVSLALAAHVAAGGSAPGFLALATAVVVLGCCSTLATGRRIGRASALAGLLTAQLGLHLWFSLASGQACSVSGPALGSHAHHAALACPPDGAATHIAAPANQAAGLGMAAAHLGAVVLTALLLAYGEALLWRLAATARTALGRLPDVRGIVVSPGTQVYVVTNASVSVGLRARPRRRGPPVRVPAT